jgi:Flp pilus assembly protein TadG
VSSRVGSSTPGRDRASRGQRGETLIEFAFASVIFFVMIFGALEFGIAVWNYNLVSDLAQEGARYAAVHGLTSGDPRSQTDVASFVTSRAIGLAVTTTTAPTSSAPGNVAAGNTVTVTVTHTLSIGGGLLPSWNFPVQSSAQMTVTR